jgi:hypothetical protein
MLFNPRFWILLRTGRPDDHRVNRSSELMKHKTELEGFINLAGSEGPTVELTTQLHTTSSSDVSPIAL